MDTVKWTSNYQFAYMDLSAVLNNNGVQAEGDAITH